jgi:hypothetical protein
VFDDDHAAVLVMSCVAPLDSVAMATNCADDPTMGVVPLTATV